MSRSLEEPRMKGTKLPPAASELLTEQDGLCAHCGEAIAEGERHAIVVTGGARVTHMRCFLPAVAAANPRIRGFIRRGV